MTDEKGAEAWVCVRFRVGRRSGTIAVNLQTRVIRIRSADMPPIEEAMRPCNDPFIPEVQFNFFRRSDD